MIAVSHFSTVKPKYRRLLQTYEKQEGAKNNAETWSIWTKTTWKAFEEIII